MKIEDLKVGDRVWIIDQNPFWGRSPEPATVVNDNGRLGYVYDGRVKVWFPLAGDTFEYA